MQSPIGNTARFEVAKKSILELINNMSDQSLTIGIRTYGTKGGSCEDSELIFPFTKTEDINLMT
jgi:hypothetical protein